MRPIAISLVLAGAVLSLAGCSRTDHQAPAPAESLEPLPSQQPPPPAAATPPAATPAPAASSSAASPASVPNDECGASKLAAYVNEVPSADLSAKIKAAAGHDRIRTIHPGDMVTLDMRPDRLNIEIGEDGRIKLFRCG